MKDIFLTEPVRTMTNMHAQGRDQRSGGTARAGYLEEGRDLPCSEP